MKQKRCIGISGSGNLKKKNAGSTKWRRRAGPCRMPGSAPTPLKKTEPGQYIIRLAMLDSSPDFESFMEELEAQSVGHCFSWGYFRRSAQLGPFDMFSDVDSRISHLNKIGQMVRLLCLANLLIGVTNTFSGASLAWLNLLCATFLAYGLGRISSKRESLVEERQLHE